MMALMGRRVTSELSESASLAVSSHQDPSPTVEPISAASKRSALSTTSSLVRARSRAVVDARRFEKRWVMAYQRGLPGSVADALSELDTYNVLHPPPGSQWADPFPVRSDGRDLIFFEQEIEGESHGHIAVAELLADGRLTAPTRVLEIGTHLSYPCVFESESTWYMVPESSASGTVSLYRATDFPWQWVKECDLVTDHRLVDCTVFRHSNKWWMLGCRVGADEHPYEDLEVFAADDLTGPWVPHSRNPVVSDATRGRPAGHVFVEDGKLVRPAQNCSVRYGYGLSFQEIVHLSESSFEERAIASRVADWDSKIIGVHTFNRSGSLSCTDFLMRERIAFGKRYF